MWRQYREIFKNMGGRYIRFRVMYELKRKSGLLKRSYPVSIPNRQFIGLEDWKALPVRFFFQSSSQLRIPRQPDPELQRSVQRFLDGEFRYFSGEWKKIGRDYDWVTNPSNGYRYPADKHWTEIADYSATSGDIKYVWEKSRFSYLYDLIRYDYHFGKDMSETVFTEIMSWIRANGINSGPNWRCSQEISLRILNWTFALYYYRDSPALTEDRFHAIIHSIYTQLLHVRANINFSRIAVRNNHAITETMMLYLSGILFPFIPETKKWKKEGKKWLEEEILYQIYEDGAYLQFSHNYHRVVIQLLTWAFFLSERNGEEFAPEVYGRAHTTLDYLYQFMDETTGELPNYGANDGALFFRLSETPYRDYRPQLNALSYYFTRHHLVEGDALREDAAWYAAGLTAEEAPTPTFLHAWKAPPQHRPSARYPQGGDYLFRDKDSFTFIKCNSFRDRPQHADNLHIDIRYKHQNILRDAGSYRYNAEQRLVAYFNGTTSHNTVKLGEHDQMTKGPRFIWFNWSKANHALLERTGDTFVFEGAITAFAALGENIVHTRKVTKTADQPVWTIEDRIDNKPAGVKAVQIWNPSPAFQSLFDIAAWDADGQPIAPIRKDGFYSEKYGLMDTTESLYFETVNHYIKTIISLK